MAKPRQPKHNKLNRSKELGDGAVEAGGVEEDGGRQAETGEG